jgi:hypothetical protein
VLFHHGQLLAGAPQLVRDVSEAPLGGGPEHDGILGGCHRPDP